MKQLTKKSKFWIVATIIFSLIIICAAIGSNEAESNNNATSSDTQSFFTSDSITETKTWENDFKNCNLKSTDKQILLNYIPDMNKCKSIEKIASSAFKLTTETASYYIIIYTGGQNIGHIASITTDEENYSDRIKLYPVEESEPEIIYENIELNILQCDYLDYYLYDGENQAKNSYLNKYVEFDMSDYYEDWVRAIYDDRLFNAILTADWSHIGNTPTDVEYTYLQIKFNSIYDVQKIMNADLGWDKIIVRGKIISFTPEGILIQGIEIVEIISNNAK